MKRIIRIGREPIFHFMLIGAGLFLLFGLIRTPGGDSLNRVVVTARKVEQLAAQFSGTWMRLPTEDDLAALPWGMPACPGRREA